MENIATQTENINFDWEALFNDDSTSEEVSASVNDQEAERNVLYLAAGYVSTKTYKEVIECFKNDYLKAKESLSVWSAKSYKSNKSTVYVGSELDGSNYSIGGINEKRKMKAISSATFAMKEAIADLKKIMLAVGFSNDDFKKEVETLTA
jgi:hypothetical protein